MGVRVSRAEKLDFCLQALDKLCKQLDKHFDTFMGYDIQFSAEGNSLYNVEFSNMFMPLENTFLSVEQLGILRTAQTLTMSLDNECIFRECIEIIDKYLELLIKQEGEV